MKLLVALLFLCCTQIQVSQQQVNCLGMADIVLILDESSSVGLANYQIMKNFTIDLIDSFEAAITAGWIQFGLLSYGTNPQNRFLLNHTSDPNVMKNVVNTMSYMNQSTETHKALFQVSFVYFTAVNGRRSSVPPIVILVTDGRSSSATNTASQAANLKSTHNATIFALGIQNASISELNDVSSDPDSKYSHFVSSFSSLTTIRELIVNETCSSIPGSAVVTGSIPSGSNLTQLITQATGGGSGTGGSGTSGTGTGTTNARTADGGLTDGQKVGLGVGIPLALVAVAVAVATGICCAKGGLGKRKSEDEKKEKDGMQTGDIAEKAAAYQNGGTVTPPV